jgi:hypothetical protein
VEYPEQQSFSHTIEISSDALIEYARCSKIDFIALGDGLVPYFEIHTGNINQNAPGSIIPTLVMPVSI